MITPDTFAPFIDPAAIGIVAGGTLAATLLRTPLRDVGRGIAALATLPRRTLDATPLIDQAAALGRIAKRHGVHTLDRSVIADKDVAAAIAEIVDGATPAEITRLLDERRRARILRHAAAADMWAGMAEVAPAMGMVGTLVGLVKMFLSMTDPKAIGAGMAVALLATLYGALIANLIAMPIAVRLRRRARAEAEERSRLVAPLAALAEYGQPRAAAIMSVVAA
ncbi:MotA/TolQ/ExbB proton channel family protein [Sphingomonas bacterium]|uniref:motility protein A n=1 Tax=Sphingomonas bacterium TaxID=1895847 RepID=UPI00262D8457|nr:MotA/TolQ/ExbB proton channel family protein [Sphingomonas bacterium]MDB5677903.1 biopolymer transporter ExbB [Sphingomonas bacterium]